VITLTATEDCFVRLIRASGGSQIYQGVIQAGSSMTWTEKQAVNVLLGNPAGVVLTVNGKRQFTNAVNPTSLTFSPPPS
jgi:hypothetical protein